MRPVSALGARVQLAELDEDPYPILAELRRAEPVAWAPALDRWLVTRRSLVLDVLLDPDAFTTESASSPIRQVLDEQMLNVDGPAQRRHREPFAPAFRGRTLREEAATSIAARVDALLDDIVVGTSADLRPLAARLAVATVVDVLGLTVDDPVLVRSWYDDLAIALANVAGDEPPFERGRATAAEVRDRLAEQLRRHATPHALVERLHTQGVSERDLGSNVLLAMFGGIETTESMILNATWALLSYPEQLAEIRADRRMLPNAIEESLRWEPAVQTCTRWATRAMRLGGQVIEAGETVECMLGAANRDPEHFADPDRFDVRRVNAGEHLAFGWGRHLCLGLHLARLETRLVLGALLDRLPALRLDPEHPSRPRGHEFRKPPSLWVCW
jgi:cytochrome P450